MLMTQNQSLSSGSHWRRWDPHLHAPGTLLNDQFGADWEGYVKAIANATPAVEVLGITDYFSIGTYRAVRKLHREGELPGVSLLFPNVEMRLEIATNNDRGINIHLLFSPDEPGHEVQIERVLSKLTFEFKGTQYSCDRSGLLTLGRAFKPLQTNDIAAIREGANQFKITLDKLRGLFKADVWLRRHCIVGVSGGSNDGTSGIKTKESESFAIVRREIEAFSQIIFTPNKQDREFWLGMNLTCNLEALERGYNGRKPCLHGSDAHDTSKVLNPDLQRYCWIKGDPTFDSLRQALLEPGDRVWIGQEAPARHDSSSCVARTNISNAPWLKNTELKWNPGLVAIIGSRGSGKTALADIVALGANVQSSHYLHSSFLHRASNPVNYLLNATVELEWGDKNISTASLVCNDSSVGVTAFPASGFWRFDLLFRSPACHDLPDWGG